MAKLDRFDLEAEREGYAIKNGNKRHGPLSKRQTKQYHKTQGINRNIQTKVERRHAT